MTDQELVLRAKKGDQDAFEQLVLDNQNKVYSLALRLTGDREEAADLAQEAFLKAWQGLPAFQGESSFATWLHRLTTNLCIDHLRRKNRRQRCFLADTSADGRRLDPFSGMCPPGLSPRVLHAGCRPRSGSFGTDIFFVAPQRATLSRYTPIGVPAYFLQTGGSPPV